MAHDVAAQFNENDWLTARTDAIDASKSTTFGYDGNGNQTTRTSASSSRLLSWDSRNTLTSVRDGTGNLLGNYDYDYKGIRVWRNTQSESIDYVLDDRSVLQELDASKSGSPQIRRYHHGTNVLAVTESPGTAFVSGTSFIVSDGMGSASDFWSSSGTLARARQFDAWGGYRNASAPASGEPKVGYTGHSYDPETGWVYARARYYDSALGIFLSRDPFRAAVSDVPSLHRYAYANGNPLSYTDPTGLQSAEAMTQQQGMGMMWDEVFAEVAGFFRGMFGGSAYISSDTSIHYSPPQGGVGGVVGGPILAVSLRTIPIEDYPSPESLAGLQMGAGLVPIFDPAERLVEGTDVIGDPTSQGWAAVGLGLDLLPLVAPKAIGIVRDFSRGEFSLSARLNRANYRLPGTLYSGLPIPEYVRPRLVPGTPGVVIGGDSKTLGKNMMEAMGLPRTTPWRGYQAQHVIPADMADHAVIRKIGMDLDDASNGLFLRVPGNDVSTLSRHKGYHSLYNTVVEGRLDAMDASASIPALERQVYELQQNLIGLQRQGVPLYEKQGASVELWDRLLGQSESAAIGDAPSIAPGGTLSETNIPVSQGGAPVEISPGVYWDPLQDSTGGTIRISPDTGGSNSGYTIQKGSPEPGGGVTVSGESDP